MIINPEIDFKKIFGDGAGFVLVDDTAPVDLATLKPCRPIPYGDEEVPPATEAAEGTCTCHQP